MMRPEYFIVAIGVPLALIGLRRGLVARFKTELILVTLMYLSSATGLASQMLLGHEFIWRDLMIFPRLAYYSAIIIFLAVAAREIRQFRAAHWLLMASALVIGLISFAQYFNLFGLNQHFAAIFGQRYEWLNEGVQWRRVIGTLGNPNYWGLTISLLLGYLIVQVFWMARYSQAPVLIFLAPTLLLTGSRAALLSLVGSLVFSGYLLWSRRRMIPNIAVVVAVVTVAATAVMGMEVGRYLENTDRYSISNTKTLEARLEIWRNSFVDVLDSPLAMVFGQGSRKGEQRLLYYGDNSYVLMWRSYGLFGLFLYLGLLGTMIQKTILLVRKADQESLPWAAGLLAGLFSWSIFELSADAWFSVPSATLMLTAYVFIHTVVNNRLAKDDNPPAPVPKYIR